MAEAFAVVGIVSSIIQIVDFGTKVVKRLNEYQSQLGDIPTAFRHVKTELPVLLDALRQTKAAIDARTISPRSTAALLPAVEGCGEQIQALDEVITKALPVMGESRRRKSLKAIKSLRYEGKAEKITTVIRGYIQTLTYHAATTTSSSSSRPPRQVAPCISIPFRRDPDFVDREILAEVDIKCQQPASRVALVGLGGVGKSQLAIEYSYRVQDRSPDTWVFWVHCGAQARFEDGYRKIAETTKMPGWDDPQADILDLVRNWLCDESNGRWLMVVDNADDSAVVFSSPGDQPADSSGRMREALSEFIPQSRNGSILITSRNREVAYRLTGSDRDILPVGPMDETHALTLLQSKLHTRSDPWDELELVKAVDCMPLAVSQAAAYINHRAPRMTVSKYVQNLKKDDMGRTRLLSEDLGDLRRDGNASNSVISTWQISFEHIRRERPSAARLLSLMSLFDRQGIPDELLIGRYQGVKNDRLTPEPPRSGAVTPEPEIDDSSTLHEETPSSNSKGYLGDDNLREELVKHQFDDDLNMLMSFSLITVDVDGSHFAMHRLVQFSTRSWLEINNELEEWKEKYAFLLDDWFPRPKPHNLRLCRSLLPHVQAAVDSRPSAPFPLEVWAMIFNKTADYSSYMAQYDTAIRMRTITLKAREDSLGLEHDGTTQAVINLGWDYFRQDLFPEGEAYFRRALDSGQITLERNKLFRIHCLNGLMAVCQSMGRLQEVEELQKEVLEALRSGQGTEDYGTLTGMYDLSVTHVKLGQWNEAADLLVEVLEKSRKVYGVDEALTMYAMSWLAKTYREQRKFDEAEELEQELLDVRRDLLGGEHPDTLSSMHTLAESLVPLGRREEAIGLMQQAYRLRCKVMGPNHKDTLNSRSWLNFFGMETLAI